MADHFDLPAPTAQRRWTAVTALVGSIGLAGFVLVACGGSSSKTASATTTASSSAAGIRGGLVGCGVVGRHAGSGLDASPPRRQLDARFRTATVPRRSAPSPAR